MAVLKKVLVIEDDDDMRAMMERLLPQWGFEASTAADGAEGLAVAREVMPDLVVCDVYLPTLTGWEVAHELRTDAKLSDVPIVFLSSSPGHEVDTRRLVREGICSYVVKGDFRALRTTLQDALSES